MKGEDERTSERAQGIFYYQKRFPFCFPSDEQNCSKSLSSLAQKTLHDVAASDTLWFAHARHHHNRFLVRSRAMPMVALCVSRAAPLLRISSFSSKRACKPERAAAAAAGVRQDVMLLRNAPAGFAPDGERTIDRVQIDSIFHIQCPVVPGPVSTE